MKRISLILVAIVLNATLLAQIIEKISYQAVIRNSSNNLVTNQYIGMKISILHESAIGSAVYAETQKLSTNANGLITLEVGGGTVIFGNFSNINWSDGPYFIKTEIDLTGGTEYTVIGTSQLLSVPYAFHSKTAESITNLNIIGNEEAFNGWDKNASDDFDGKYNSLSGIPINISSFINDAGYLTNEVDGSVSNELQMLSISKDTIYLSNGGFIKLPVEFSGSFNDLLDIPENLDIDATDDFSGDYNELSNKPDLSEYLTAEVDGSLTNEIQLLSIRNDTIYLSNGGFVKLPYGFSGSFNDLSDIPANLDIDITDDFSGDYNDLSNKPNLSVYATKNMANQNITNLADPVNNQDAVTKAYVDNLLSRIDELEALTTKVKDANGNLYSTVKIGNQIWMVENLKTTRFNDGTAIQLITGDIDWSNLSTPAYCWFNNDESKYKNSYGALYNWYAVNTDKLCPTGWHVPSDDEWTTLTIYLGGESIAGGKLKEADTIHWKSPNIGATNETAFTALPGNSRHGNGTFYLYIGYYGYWWSSTESSSVSLHALYRSMNYNYSHISRNECIKNTGQSVRCIRD